MSAVHARTPNVVAVDGRGLPTRQVAYLRSQACESAVALITRQRHNVIGHLVEQWDPRLFGHGPKPNQATLHNLAGQPLHTDSVDAGWRLVLPGLAGKTWQRWDERGNHWRIAYDPQLRPVALEENGQADIDTFTYANATADADHNLRGQLLEQVDPSGTLHLDSYGLLGHPLRQTRTFHDGMTLTNRRTHDPLGAVLEQTDAGEHQRQWRYDLAGQLKGMQLRLLGQTDWQPVLHDAQYNAAGQMIEQRAGNGVVSDWTYDLANARLLRQRSRKDEMTVLVDFEYAHDPVGNVTRILDHTFTPTHFANQRVDGQRAFGYDSLYRLFSASGYDDGLPSDIPGLPQPTDPNNRLNYRQTYEYDIGGNLTKLTHVREGASHTRQMYIDPNSNRGVRWKPGDPTPSFGTLFDRHGNLQALQPGQALQWNARDQMACATLLDREDGPNDEEHYRYSQGMRVYKRHETHTATHSHFQDVRYLPGLEIRTQDNGEELHVLTLDAGFASVRCLHWVTGKPTGIEADQLRYSLEDHLGSSVMELDQRAQLISHEGYYPFGATAWMTARSSVEVSYRTVRYSGKEMDASGLYYYGARYYAPWLQRWIGPDPLGNIDGLNRYSMVRNNPVSFVDEQGAMTRPPPSTPTETAIQMSASLSRTSSTDSNTAGSTGTPAPLDDPENNPPPLPSKPDETWRAWARRMALEAVNSRVGLALLPVGTSSPANAAIVSTVLTAAAQLTIHATLFNPGWSPPGSWDPSGDGSLPPVEVTQGANRTFVTTTLAITTAGAVIGAALGPVVGGYVDELRGTKDKAEKKTQAGKWIDTIDKLIADHRTQDEVSEKAQRSLHDQVLEVEELIGITWQTMGMLEKIARLRPASRSAGAALLRQASDDSQRSTVSHVIQRNAPGRTPKRKYNPVGTTR
ncbi:toxin [Pseudomonas brassicacearum]|uniref:RHS repeat-associated core domain-containing protein n=1 Tax=Pseudomonas brassicacearum TaxID=930166 RepID=UPI00042F22CF|nr:RHS repeat-associated core domain-containing protein [Pseudomonas brassicacearum]AHL35703.1 toxin [Pseudomonas brassicacearum]